MSTLTLRRKLVASACAAVLALGVPAMAFAAPSPSNTGTLTGTNNVVINVGGTTVSGEALPSDFFLIESVSKLAPNTPADANVLASFEVTTSYDLDELGRVVLTFNVGSQYAGGTAIVYVQHEDGSEETLEAVVDSDGTITVTVDRLSVFTVTIDLTTVPEGTTPNVDKGATSPQTGVGVIAIAGATGAMAVAAGGVGAALRKKVRG
ncbi:MAG: hypothetical protein KHY83_01890 [Coriobacteriia bacterium]|nr:hypothetical protein [Coriobacteriia bacterium]MBS5477403.1 hypothetical protein [Coriobacteriia bacterium]